MRAEVPDELDPRAADGRIPGRRGLATRQRLLECTEDLLGSSSYRDLKVVDITREAGTSPATFYQYFPDVEAAILELAGEMAGQGARFAQVVRDTTWKGKAAWEGSLTLVDEFLRFWEDHAPVMRVIDLATAEGDRRFTNVRTRLLNVANNALADAVAEARDAGRVPADTDPLAVAGVLVAMLAHVSAHQQGFQNWGVRPDDLRLTMARMVHWSVSGQKPPA